GIPHHIAGCDENPRRRLDGRLPLDGAAQAAGRYGRVVGRATGGDRPRGRHGRGDRSGGLMARALSFATEAFAQLLPAGHPVSGSTGAGPIPRRPKALGRPREFPLRRGTPPRPWAARGTPTTSSTNGFSKPLST